MTEYALLSAFLIGLAGSVHCAGMCGGIVASFSYILPKDTAHWPYLIYYNLGRIMSYTIAGAFAGWLGATITSADFLSAQLLPMLSGVFLVLLGFYISGWWRVLTHLESLGQHFWKWISPISKRFLPMRTPIKALPYGMIWGWLPCGLVYSALSWSLASGNWLSGALSMAFFGFGTLPILLAIGSSGKSLVIWLRNPTTRTVIALILLGYGLLLMLQAVNNW